MSTVPPPEVVHRHVLALGVLETVGQRGCGRLVDDARDLEPRDESRVLRGLPLGIIEIGGAGDDGFFHRLPEVVLGRGFELGENEGRDLRGGVDLLLDLDVHVAVGRFRELVRHEAAGLLHLGRVELAPDEPLHREDRVLGVGEGLALRDLADEAFPLGGEADDGRCGARALLIGDDLGGATLHHRYAGVRGSEIDSDQLAHIEPRSGPS